MLSGGCYGVFGRVLGNSCYEIQGGCYGVARVLPDACNGAPCDTGAAMVHHMVQGRTIPSPTEHSVHGGVLSLLKQQALYYTS